MTKHDFLLHTLLISCSNRKNTSCTFSSDIYFQPYSYMQVISLVHLKLKWINLRDELYNLCVIWKIIYAGFTGSYQDKYDMLPNLNQDMGGNPYLISLDPIIMCFLVPIPTMSLGPIYLKLVTKPIQSYSTNKHLVPSHIQSKTNHWFTLYEILSFHLLWYFFDIWWVPSKIGTFFGP